MHEISEYDMKYRVFVQVCTLVNHCTWWDFFFLVRHAARLHHWSELVVYALLARWSRYRSIRRKNARPEIFRPMLTSNSRLRRHRQTRIHYFFFTHFLQRLSAIVSRDRSGVVAWRQTKIKCPLMKYLSTAEKCQKITHECPTYVPSPRDLLSTKCQYVFFFYSPFMNSNRRLLLKKNTSHISTFYRKVIDN